MDTFSAGSCIRFGWEAFKKRSWFFVGSFLLFYAIVIVVSAAVSAVITYGGIAALVGTLARIAVQMLTGMGMTAFALKAHDDIEHVTFADFWHPFPFWKYTGTTLLFVLVLVVGLVLLVVPGIIWGIMFGFAPYLVIDKRLSPIEALKESRRMVYGYKWELFLLGVLSVLIVLLGFICLFVGVLVAYPVVMIAFVHAFRTLAQKAGPAPAA